MDELLLVLELLPDVDADEVDELDDPEEPEELEESDEPLLFAAVLPEVEERLSVR